MPAASVVTPTVPDSDIHTESVRIPSSAGELAGELCYALARPSLGCALFNPHPFMGGQMDNNVIRELARSLPAHGAVTLRFDYSGVGESAGRPVDVGAAMLAFWETGSAPNDPQMLSDARAAARWLFAATRKPQLLIGYSFGSYAAAQAIDENVAGIVLISPTLRQHDYSALARCALPKLVIHGDDDFATPRAEVEHWLQSLTHVRSLCIPGGEHFFKQKERQVVEACAQFTASLVSTEVSACP